VRLQTIELYAVALAWVLFAIEFLARKRSPRARETVRAPRSIAGLALQVAGLAIVRLGMRPSGASFLHLGPLGNVAIAAVALAVLAGSLVLIQSALRTLGKQWSLAARLVEGHDLVTTGPYRLVRHPIYTGLFGMLLGTALALSQWPALLAASAVFLIGTLLRVRAEERLLLAAFGDAYRDYALVVPALIPRWPRANKGVERTGKG
jgi:protein-S-isoprenylcysteine O-methyltransferase Ste14